ncbi:hypothetical protein UO65_2361 [Actinokineospora spheciospongiae]|uniref:Uncharacterized protein n=1 Tax=Actinokineospora spheciospongiae TaxID=909613 RepID=W7J8M3_9PSEU|nr:hypothetical protein [Actinokineospora spheciospongiae]EWC62374.1 hypothetical protein UO65_2361 [Actinokineospora spheciospongiae]
MPVVLLSRHIEADPHGVVLLLRAHRIVEFWPDISRLAVVGEVHHLTAELPGIGSRRLEVRFTSAVRGAGSFLVAFVVSGDLAPVAGALRVSPAVVGERGGTVLSLSLDHEHANPAVDALAERFLSAVQGSAELRAHDA